MLRAMKAQLKYLTQKDKDNFHVQLRIRVGKKATAILEERLKRIILLMPDLVSRIYFYWNKSRTNAKSKKLGRHLLTYLCSPGDFLSEKEWGLFGYLDDAYFVSRIYTEVIDDVSEKKQKVAAVDLKNYEEAKFLKKYIRGVIPKETKKIDDMILQLSEGNQRIYSKLFKK